MPKSVKQLINEIDLWKDAYHIRYEPLQGGCKNDTYKVTADEVSYVLRMNDQQNTYLQLDRPMELKALSEANRFGITPEVMMTENATDCVITAYIDGSMLKESQLKDPEIASQLISKLKLIHSLEGIERTCTPYHLIESYVAGMDTLGVKAPIDFKAMLNRMYDIERYRSQDRIYTRKYCHNDLFLVNTLYDGKNVYIIDWKLSGCGDVFFDLASIPFSVSFTHEEEKQWLASYFGDYDEEQSRILQDMKWLNMLREAAWSLLHTGLHAEGEHQRLDYYKYALRVMERMEMGLNTLA
ncbi:phosphotransferase [Paenibacillus sp. OSY-SE]|uniref:phosphotransferase n=1 Tax=Paenibacillus sp. OSY-SE TaxID=1196323 RepID=UPI0002DCEF55|nr:phosphotransferase [Paenibacillus sp. OSY-SE]